MIRAVSVVLQTMLFLLLYGIGSFLPAFGLMPPWQAQTGPHRFFVWNGLFLALVAFLLILLIQTVRKRLRGTAGLTTLAFALALALGLAMKLGFKTA